MLFINIPDIVSAGAINILQLECSAGDTVGIFLSVGSGPDSSLVFEDRHIAFTDGVSLFGIGDILRLAGPDVVAFDCSIVVNIAGKRSEKNFLLVKSSVIDPGFDFRKNFLTAGKAAICPPGTLFTLAAIPDDRTNPSSFDLKGFCKGKEMDFSDSLKRRDSGGAVLFDIKLPEQTGSYHVRLGKRRFSFFVAEIDNWHSIEFRNHFNAPDIIHLQGSLSLAPSMTAQKARINYGMATVYDIVRTVKLEFHATKLQESVYRRLMFLGYGSNFRIDGMPVVISDIEPKHSRESAELYELKFSAMLDSAAPDALAEEDFKIFTRHFNYNFN